MEPAFTLANIPLDLQITICIFLHPADILSLRKTCKALELATRQRIVWVAVFHRVCVDNALFLPGFPIPDMSGLELERAATAPRRWVEICDAFQMRHSNDFSNKPRLRTTRIIEDEIFDLNALYIVPGGRYLVTAGRCGLSVWDLGYVSTVDCRLVASVGPRDRDYGVSMVQATPDGKGLVILTSYGTYIPDHLSIFEIYPQSETPLLTQIAHFHWIFSEEFPVHLLPDILISRGRYSDRVDFRVVDYRRNYSTYFSLDFDVKNGFIKTFATKTAIVGFCKEEILIWAIPPLSPQPSDLPDHFLDNDFTLIPPLFKIPFPDGILRPTHSIFSWMILSSWYFGCWESIYFGIIFSDSKIQKFKLIIKPDLSGASLHFINMSEIISDDLLINSINETYRICDDALVCSWRNDRRKEWGAYAGLTSAPFTNVITKWDGHLGSLCPTSGRFVYLDDSNERSITGSIAVVDLF